MPIGRCCIPGCTSKQSMPGIHLYRFPKNIERCEIWKNNCNLNELRDLTAEVLYDKYRICSLHFENRMRAGMCKERLKCDAVPTIFDHNPVNQAELEDTVAMDISETSVANQNDFDVTNHDHIYIKNEPELIIQEPEFVDIQNAISNSPVPESSIMYIQPIITSDVNTKTKIKKKDKNLNTSQITRVLTLSGSQMKEIKNKKMVFIPVSEGQKNAQTNNDWDTYENFIKMCDTYLPPHFSKIAKIQALFHKKRKKN